MPVLGKHTLTRFLGTDCQKQLRILLAPETRANPERQSLGMPPKQPPLPGLNAIAQAGDEWAASRLAELDAVMGSHVLIGTRKRSSNASGIEFASTPLLDSLTGAIPQTFLAEHTFEVGPAFQEGFNVTALIDEHGLTFDNLRPDLIEIRSPGTTARIVKADGSVTDLPDGDARRQLRIIDIKLTAQPGPGYFAEVVYYSVALAGWLVDHKLDSDFVVCPDPAIWPGNHEASALITAQTAAREQGISLSASDAFAAVQTDLEVAPLPVFVSSLQHFFNVTLPEVLSQPWQQLPYHVTSRCRGCDFLGQAWGANSGVDPLHCLPTAAATGHLSQIAFVGRGASALLAGAGSDTVSAVAALEPTDPAFDLHHSLRGQRTVIASRAESLTSGDATGIAPRSGTSAVLPVWSDLSVYITADFDASSAITLALGLSGYWREPTPFGQPRPAQPNFRVWNSPKAFVVDSKTLKREEEVLLQFLAQIDSIIQFVRSEDASRGAAPGDLSTIQFYIWDDLTYRHLCRIVGRHLEAILAAPNGLRTLAWLFPPEEILHQWRLMADPVITIVGDAVRSLVALPISHYYSLLRTARLYHTRSVQPPYDQFRMPTFWEDPLSDQIPSERAHDVWRRGPHFANTITNLQRAVGTRLQALEEVTKRLRQDLREQDLLHRRAPRQSVLAPPQNVARLTADELLLLAFTKLNHAVEAQEAARRRAMPPHEREARFVAARFTRRLTGRERDDAFQALNMTGTLDHEVYEVRPNSAQANFKEGDFLCALVPEHMVEILDWKVGRFVRKIAGPLAPNILANFGQDQYAAMSDVLSATLVRFDRDLNLAVVEMDSYKALARQALLGSGLLSLDRHVSLEKTSKDFFSDKLEATLRAIGRTPKAVASPIAARALGRAPAPQASASVPVEDVLWDAPAMAATPVPRDVQAAKAALINAQRDLNASQWSAFDHALTHRLALLWGPPGTGKSRTVTNIIAGAVYDAATAQRPLRILVASSTYNAIDNVLSEVAALVQRMSLPAQVWRCRSGGREPAVAPVIDCAISRHADAAQQTLQDRLTVPGTEITVVGASGHQLHRLAEGTGLGPTAPLFDLIVIDEASQVDVANAVLPLATLASGGSIVIAGDPLQLPPIHQVEPPEGTEHLVGSIYDFIAKHHKVPSQNLTVNYRSNDEIVALARDADYPPGLVAHNPRLRLNLLGSMPADVEPPFGWPSELVWSPDLPLLLDPDKPVTCLVYRDGLSGQSNPFEAQVVAGLTWLLHNRLADQLDGEAVPTGHPVPPSNTPYAVEALFATGIGVVTPHRAQQSMISTLIGRVLPAVQPGLVRAAVDTVERFQGQQRDVIVASYAVGDPDTIADEDEFLQSLNRFNVMASRARAKLIVLVSEELLQHLPTDIDVLRASGLLKAFADIRCRLRSTVRLSWDDRGTVKTQPASLRWS
ncbi:DEAD/DEAH box helicase [Blastococcus sp. KM273129]|uniref:DEAD/DEAH box helicase n=1 Tax=Blastococcus sp. KM273129 TaxID=2570315 RepID=UPI001F159875|nr:AAA domain-containing protein [Blastococcus sp. KM273129]